MKQNVKNVIMIMLLGLCLCMRFSNDVEAASESIKINGINILTAETMPEGVSYDATSNTLTLDSLDMILDPYTVGVGVEVFKDNINIVLKGKSTIVGYDNGGIGIFSLGDMNISGSGELILDNCYLDAMGAITIQESNITINDVYGIESSKLSIKSGTISVSATKGNAIKAKDGVDISGGEITFTSTDMNTVQIEEGEFMLTGGSVEITPDDNTQPIYSYNGIKIYGGKIKLNGNLSRSILLKNGVAISLETGSWFSPDNTYTVTIIGGTGSGSYKAGDTVTIKANGNKTQKFTYWLTEKGTYTGLENIADEETTFVMPMRDVTVTAHYTYPLPKGTYINTDDASYKVINGNFDNPTVAYWGHFTTKKKLTSISVPNTFTDGYVTYKVVSISDEAFKNHKHLKTLKIGDNVTTIGKSAFQNCKSLNKVTFGKKVKTINSKAFYGCKNLKNITFKGTALKTIKSKAFKNTHSKATIKVPSKKYKNYKKLLKKSSVGFSKKVKIKK